MSRLIDADAFVTVQLYDDEHEEYYEERMTISEALDRYTSEGCPPTIEPKHGEWIVSYIDGIKQTECSVCGVFFTTYDVYGWNYCPWCGARMKGADDETDNI